MLEYILKITKNIDASANLDQLEVCLEMINNFETTYKPEDRISTDLRGYYGKKQDALSGREGIIPLN